MNYNYYAVYYSQIYTLGKGGERGRESDIPQKRAHMKHRDKKLLRKMGYSKHGEDYSMDVKDIIELGKMGYTKEEITQLQEQAEKQVPEDLINQIDALNQKIEDLTKSQQMAQTRVASSVTDPGISDTQSVDEILSKLAYGDSVNGQK